MLDMQVMRDASEVVHYDRPDIPVYIKNDNLADYTNRSGLCHWHDDLEIILIVKGQMNYHINGKTIPLKEQDCVIINSRQLHYGFSGPGGDCMFLCIRFHPKLLGGSQGVYERYILPFISHSQIEYLFYDTDSPHYAFIRKCVTDIRSLKEEQKDAYELEIISVLNLLWRRILEQCKNILSQQAASDSSDLSLQKQMVSYIQEHYQETLTLDEIAASASISRSKCCMIFRQYLKQPPIDFLNKYRLEISRYLLAHTRSAVTEIALSCGFNHLSYFSKLFLREYSCTPSQYRRHLTSAAANTPERNDHHETD